MSNLEGHVQVIGIVLILLALVHVIFPKYFNWKQEMSSLSLINRQMFLVHTFFIAFMVLLMGVLCVLYPDDLVGTSFGHVISLGLSIFWGVRFIFQVAVYSSALWKGKIFETIVHIIFTFTWAYFAVIFGLAASSY